MLLELSTSGSQVMQLKARYITPTPPFHTSFSYQSMRESLILLSTLRLPFSLRYSPPWRFLAGQGEIGRLVRTPLPKMGLQSGDRGYHRSNDRLGGFKASVSTHICFALWNVDLQHFMKLVTEVTLDFSHPFESPLLPMNLTSKGLDIFFPSRTN